MDKGITLIVPWIPDRCEFHDAFFSKPVDSNAVGTFSKWNRSQDEKLIADENPMRVVGGRDVDRPPKSPRAPQNYHHASGDVATLSTGLFFGRMVHVAV